jgi:DnaK suppressor protein
MRLDSRQHDQLRRALEQRREALVEEINRESKERPAGPPDAGEAADESRDFAELRAIEAARQRMSDGTYGRCTDCGVDIGLQRLRAEPEAARCIDCQRRHEKTNRR